MEEMERYVTELSEAVWSQTLGLPLHPSPAVPPAPTGGTIEGHVHITGRWTGTLVFQCSRTAARRAAQVMFGLEEEDDNPQDVQDAVGELANMIGGNLKALFSDDGCYLSLPTVIEGRDYHVRMSGTQVVARQAFESDEEPVIVTLLRPQ